MKSIIFWALLMPLVAFALPTAQRSMDAESPDSGFRQLDLWQGQAYRLTVELTERGTRYTSTGGYTAELRYGSSSLAAEYVIVTATSVTDGLIIFDLAPSDTNTSGTFEAFIYVEDASGNPYVAGNGRLRILRTSVTGVIDPLLLSTPINFSEWDATGDLDFGGGTLSNVILGAGIGVDWGDITGNQTDVLLTGFDATGFTVTESQISDLDKDTSAEVDAKLAVHTGDTANPHSTSLSNLTDTVQGALAERQAWMYDGTNWVNRLLVEADISDLDKYTQSAADLLFVTQTELGTHEDLTEDAHNSNEYRVTKDDGADFMYAINNAVAGQTIYVPAGTYVLTADLTHDTACDIVVPGAEGGNRAILTGIFSFTVGADCTVEGLDVTGLGTPNFQFIFTDNATPTGTLRYCDVGDYAINYWQNKTNNFDIVGTEIGSSFCFVGTNNGDITNSIIGNDFCGFDTNNGAITDSTFEGSFCSDGTNNATVRDTTFARTAATITARGGTYINCIDSAGVLFSTPDAVFNGELNATTIKQGGVELGSAAFTASGDYATDAQGTLADTALQAVEDDTEPKLGGNLDADGNEIKGAAAMEFVSSHGTTNYVTRVIWNAEDQVFETTTIGTPQ